MDNYNLQQNEAVIMKSERVLYGGMLAVYSDELILTNLNIILIQKGTFGKTKNIRYFPTNQIKCFNGKAQAIVSKQQSGLPKLEVYFHSGQESFGFEKKKEAEKWVDNINRLLAGEVEFNNTDSKAIPGAEFVAETVKDTFEAFRGVFGKKGPDEERVAKYCTSCGASISGIKGRVVRCQYCNSEQQL